jgi:hypothetical protein
MLQGWADDMQHVEDLLHNIYIRKECTYAEGGKNEMNIVHDVDARDGKKCTGSLRDEVCFLRLI